LSVQLPSVDEQVAREHEAYLQVERHIFETEVKPRITQEIIDEHKNRPVGKHSDELQRVLIYLRKNHLEMVGKYNLVCTKPHKEYRLVTLSGIPGVPPELMDDTFSSRSEAEHGLFMKRLSDAGLLPG
jgi:septation ring formation regulator EzrA